MARNLAIPPQHAYHNLQGIKRLIERQSWQKMEANATRVPWEAPLKERALCRSHRAYWANTSMSPLHATRLARLCVHA